MSKKKVDLKETKFIAEFSYHRSDNTKPFVDCPPTRAFKGDVAARSWNKTRWFKVKEDGTLMSKKYDPYNVSVFPTFEKALEYYDRRVQRAIKDKKAYLASINQNLTEIITELEGRLKR